MHMIAASFNFNDFILYCRYSLRLTYVFPVVFGISFFAKNKDQEEVATNEDRKSPRNSIALKEKPMEKDSEVILTLKRAKLAERKQKLDQADELYHHALGLVSIHQKEKSWSAEKVLQAQVYIFDCMANLALSRGQLADAEKLFKETVKGLMQQGVKADDNAIVELSLKLAVIYASQNRSAEAEIGYKFCIDTQEKKIESASERDIDTVALLGMSVDAYARYLVTRKDYEAAMQNLNKALAIAISVLGESHQQVAVLLNDMATVASLTNDFSTAQEKLLKAVDIAEKIESAHLPTLYCNLGAVYFHQQNPKEALVSYKKAIKSAKKLDDKKALMKAEEGLSKLKSKG